MSTLKDKLKKLSFFTHYPKEHESLTINNVTEEYSSKEEKWNIWLNNYTNGIWYLGEGYDDIIDQHYIMHNDVEQKIGARVIVDVGTQSGVSVRRYTSRIKFWGIDEYHENQKAKITCINSAVGEQNWLNVDLEYGTTFRNVYQTNYLQTSTIPTSARNFTIIVEIPPYLDEENNIYYTGAKYQSDITNAPVSNKSEGEATYNFYDVIYL